MENVTLKEVVANEMYELLGNDEVWRRKELFDAVTTSASVSTKRRALWSLINSEKVESRKCYRMLFVKRR